MIGRRVADYRPDIDGLRALAVLSVVAFHAAPKLLPGGYTGVDVFFVISGCVITRLIDSELVSGTFSFGRFYRRRVRRIIPPLVVVSIVVLCATYFLFVPDTFKKVAESALGSSVFLANVFFERQGGYFFGPVHDWPLLHTWSLSVEEQFYLAWPALMVVSAKLLSGNARLAAVGVLTLASLLLSEHWAQVAPNAAFYLTLSRAWELGLGALTALSRQRTPAWLRGPHVPVLGLALVLYGLIRSQHTAFPGFHALPSCLGTALLIVGNGAGPGWRGNPIGRFFSHPVAVYVGLVSYPLYLWHWPLLCGAQLLTGGRPGAVVLTLTVLASFAAAVLSYHALELPVRQVDERGQFRFGDVPLLVSLGLATLAIVLVGVGAHRTNGFAEHVSGAAHGIASRDQVVREKTPACVRDRSGLLCSYGGARRALLVWGDSHADVVGRVLALSPLARQFRVIVASMGACPPVSKVSVLDDHGQEQADCEHFNREIARSARGEDLAAIVLAARWTLYTPGESVAARPLGSFTVTAEVSRGGGEPVFEGVAALLAQLPLGVPALLVGQPPEFFMAPRSCVLSRYGSGLLAGRCQNDRASLRNAWRAIDDDLERLTKLERKVGLVDLLPPFCPGATCSGVDLSSGSLLYRDDNHLNFAGMERVVPLVSSAVLGVISGQ